VFSTWKAPHLDPWYDYLALPVAPLVLTAQGVALRVSHRRLRWALSFTATAAIAAIVRLRRNAPALSG
jgi:hypothetical protein